MDIVTQGLAGAIVATSAARAQALRHAALVGAFAGLLADADIFIRSPDDALLTLEYHRQFTHSLFFIPFGALIAALLLWPFLRRHLTLARVYLFALLGYLPSGLLDAGTSYGTQLLWPLSDARIAWNLIAVIDPLFTGVLALSLGIALVKRMPAAARVGLALAVGYFLLGAVQRERAEAAALALAQARGHAAERLTAKPTLGNLMLWRTLYEAGERFYIDAVRVGLGAAQVYPGRSLPRFRAHGLPADSVLARDIARFTRFSDGFVALHPDKPQILGDIRYARLPNSAKPLWGIEIDRDRPQQHVAFHTFREVDAHTRRQFWRMLRGAPLDEAPGRDTLDASRP